MYTKEESRKNIKKLTESFGEKLDFIQKSGQYKEAQIDDEFIKPLFKYLNWNTSNEGISNASDREFIVQAKGRNGKEPDYLLKLNDKPCFYIEAKHSKYYLGGMTEDKGKVKERTDYIWQAYSFAYSTQTRPSYEKVDFVLLTNFNEFRFFNCSTSIQNKEDLNQYCILDWTYKDYITNFEKLWRYFEKENVRNGSLKKFYISNSKKEKRISVTESLLENMEDWREKLASDIIKYQPDFSGGMITESVYLLLSRFIFLKVLSDRDIEEDYIQSIVNRIHNIKEKEEYILFKECKDIFDQLDKTYNGSIFKINKELNNIILSKKNILYVLESFLPEYFLYNFQVISVGTLCAMYEQFIGNEVRATTGKRAIIESKSDIRKMSGILNEPDYIVNYIIDKTVGEKLETCRTFEQLLQIKICDPACGTGIFLVFAYDALIQWAINFFEIKNQSNRLRSEEERLIYIDENNKSVRLTPKAKREILQSCIFGVDNDSQAVEVTKLILYLKILENLTRDEIYNEKYDNLWPTEVLPSMDKNIKCGNSLIKPNILSDISLVEKDALLQMNCFDWEKEFQIIFQDDNGGFDCVIGNPPALSLQMSNGNLAEYYSKIYQSFSKTGDTSYLFYERGLSLINKQGVLCYYTHSNWSQAKSGEEIRRLIIATAKPILFIYIVGLDKTILDANILFLSKQLNQSNSNLLACRVESDFKEEIGLENYVNTYQVTLQIDSNPWIVKNLKQMKVKDRFIKIGVKLSEWHWHIQISRGIEIKFKNAFLIDKKTKEELIRKDAKNKEFIKPLLMGNEIQRWISEIPNYWLICLPPNFSLDNDDSTHEKNISSEKKFQKNYPTLYDHLMKYEMEITEIKNVEQEHFFTKFLTSNYNREFNEPKIVFPRMTSKFDFCLEQNGYYLNESLLSITGENIKYLIALLNSRIIAFILANFYSASLLNANRIDIGLLKELPLPLITKEQQLPFIIMVDWILFAKENKMEKELSTIESVLDAMVVDLYFENDLKRAGCYILDKISDILKPLKEEDSFESKKEYLEKLYKLFLQDKIIYNSLIHRRNIDSIKIIYGDANDS